MASNDPTNSGTKAQIKRFFDNAIKKAQNPDDKDKIRRIRAEKAKKVAKKFGF